jgi:hypothetical protein
VLDLTALWVGEQFELVYEAVITLIFRSEWYIERNCGSSDEGIGNHKTMA